MFLFFFVSSSFSTVYFEEEFDDDWDQRWVYSRHRPVQGSTIQGVFQLSTGNYYANANIQRGLQTVTDMGYYQITSKLKKPFNTSGKDFVLQFTIRFEGGYDCSGGYVKILGPETKPLKFNSFSPYLLMFGPEVCDKTVHKLNFIIPRNNTQYEPHKYVDVPTDELTHSYTLIIYANKTYDVRIDGESVLSGDINSDFETGGVKWIADPTDSKPLDWDDREEIPDPNDKKPADWDERPTLPDPTARQPPEWREAVQGKWQPPQIKNPDYLGVWKPKMIKNPHYQGEWVPKQIINPEYVDDPNFGVWENITYWGIEVFQSQAGAIFDNFLLTDDVEYSEKKLRENFLVLRDDERIAMKRYLQDKEADDVLHKIQNKDLIDTTTAAFYSSSYSSSSSKSGSDAGETDSAFIFPSSEMSSPPVPSDFEFPLNIENNLYFIKKEKQKLQVSSQKAREDFLKKRIEKREENEESEDFRRFRGETSTTEL